MIGTWVVKQTLLRLCPTPSVGLCQAHVLQKRFAIRTEHSFNVSMSTLTPARPRPRSPSYDVFDSRKRRRTSDQQQQPHHRSSSSSSSNPSTTKDEEGSSYDSTLSRSTVQSSVVSMAIESSNAAPTSSAAASQKPRLLVQLDPDHPNAKAPTRGSALAAGYDLYASQSVVIAKSGGRTVVPTGIRLAIPPECYGRVAPRSGLASKHGIDVGAGVIDADYRGLLGVLLFNFGTEDFTIEVGDRIAQLVLERVMLAEVETVESLDDTLRGAGGFGSTGGFGKPAAS